MLREYARRRHPGDALAHPRPAPPSMAPCRYAEPPSANPVLTPSRRRVTGRRGFPGLAEVDRALRRPRSPELDLELAEVLGIELLEVAAELLGFLFVGQRPGLTALFGRRLFDRRRLEQLLVHV